mmetsp:Transcript_21461/g.54060  ORF Transcript_21461/g.54060 Transcript_21461/m.54060 type:complete len:251 (+) Transcript_21461:45-797(+)
MGPALGELVQLDRHTAALQLIVGVVGDGRLRGVGRREAHRAVAAAAAVAAVHDHSLLHGAKLLKHGAQVVVRVAPGQALHHNLQARAGALAGRGRATGLPGLTGGAGGARRRRNVVVLVVLLHVTVLAILPHQDLAARELLAVDLVHRLDGLLRGLKLHDAPALGALVLIAHHVGVHDGADLAELVLQVLPGRPPGKVADIAALADAHHILLAELVDRYLILLSHFERFLSSSPPPLPPPGPGLLHTAVP